MPALFLQSESGVSWEGPQSSPSSKLLPWVGTPSTNQAALTWECLHSTGSHRIQNEAEKGKDLQQLEGPSLSWGSVKYLWGPRHIQPWCGDCHYIRKGDGRKVMELQRKGMTGLWDGGYGVFKPLLWSFLLHKLCQELHFYSSPFYTW